MCIFYIYNIYIYIYGKSTAAEADMQDSSDDGCREGMSDSDNSIQISTTTPAERYLWGLQRGKQLSRSNVLVANVKGRGRSAFAAKNFCPGDFVCEYASCIRDPDDSWSEERNASLGIGSYCLDATYQGKVVTFDASSRINDPGRYAS